jgi:hypothetical protein
VLAAAAAATADVLVLLAIAFATSASCTGFPPYAIARIVSKMVHISKIEEAHKYPIRRRGDRSRIASSCAKFYIYMISQLTVPALT